MAVFALVRRLLRHPYLPWALTRLLLVAFIFLPVVGGRILFSDVLKYRAWGHGLVTWTSVPYRDFAWEYPPGAALVIGPPGAFWYLYKPVFVTLMLLADLGVVVALRRLAARLGAYRGVHVWVWGVALLGPLLYVRYDVVSSLLAVLAVLALSSGAAGLAGAAIGGGVITKLWPVVLLLAVPFVAGRRRLLVAFGATLAATALVVLAAGGAKYGDAFLRHQQARGLQVEAVAATPLVIAERAGAAVDISLYQSSGSWDVTGTGAAGALKVADVATLLAALLVLVLLWRVRRRPESYLDLAATALLLALVTGKVLSPQYLLWALAMLAAALCRPGSRLALPGWLVVAAAPLTQLVYPAYYRDLVNGGGIVVVEALAVRNVLLLVATVIAVVRVWSVAGEETA
jgi:hypothetical protein